MSEQIPLFGQPEAYARWTDPDTSHDAAESLKPEHLSHLQQIALDALRELGGRAITEELCDHTRIEWKTLSPRMRPLQRLGKIRDTGERWEARSGRKCILWELCE